MPQPLLILNLGRVAYAPAWELQRRLQERLIVAKRADPPEEIPHVLLEVEHPPVYTLGKSGKPEHLLASEEELDARGATFYHIDRGGDITFHGPGQLVGYPILDLNRFSPDIHRYLRDLEEVIIATCSDFGIASERVAGRTGVWVPADGRAGERKICAMGIRCSRWVTMHGFALNVATDLSFFSHIVPCGISNRDVTSIARETGASVVMEDVFPVLERHFARLFDVSTRRFEGEAAFDALAEYLGESVPAGLLLH